MRLPIDKYGNYRIFTSSKETKNMTTITVTPEIRKEILEGIREAQRLINYEMSFSEDLRKNDLIETYRNYITKMAVALVTGKL